MRSPLHVRVGLTILALALAVVDEASAFSSSCHHTRPKQSQHHHHPAITTTALCYANDPAVPIALPHNNVLVGSNRGTRHANDGTTTTKSDASPPQALSKRDLAWNRRYQELVAYHDRYGNADVPLNLSENTSLATWVINQRRKRRKASPGLKQYQIDALDAIDFRWNPRTPWAQRFAELKQYKSKHGNCIVPSNDEEYRDLYVWCCNQRQQYRFLCENGSSALTSDRAASLVSIGFFDFDGNMQKASWNMRLQELQEYKALRGDCNVPRHYAANPKLGRWVDTQRTAFRLKKLGKASPLTQDRVDVLNGMGFEWNPAEKMHKMAYKANRSTDPSKKKKTKRKKKNTPWLNRYKELQRYKQRYGHVLVSQSTQLGNWVKAQRWQYKLMQKGEKSSMSAARFALLNDLGVFNRQDIGDIKVMSVTHGSNALGTTPSTSEHAVASAPFVRPGMSDDELLAAWHERYREFRRD